MEQQAVSSNGATKRGTAPLEPQEFMPTPGKRVRFDEGTKAMGTSLGDISKNNEEALRVLNENKKALQASTKALAVIVEEYGFLEDRETELNNYRQTANEQRREIADKTTTIAAGVAKIRELEAQIKGLQAAPSETDTQVSSNPQPTLASLPEDVDRIKELEQLLAEEKEKVINTAGEHGEAAKRDAEFQAKYQELEKTLNEEKTKAIQDLQNQLAAAQTDRDKAIAKEKAAVEELAKVREIRDSFGKTIKKEKKAAREDFLETIEKVISGRFGNLSLEHKKLMGDDDDDDEMDTGPLLMSGKGARLAKMCKKRRTESDSDSDSDSGKSTTASHSTTSEKDPFGDGYTVFTAQSTKFKTSKINPNPTGDYNA